MPASDAKSEAKKKAIPHVRELLADELTPLGAYRRLAAVSPVRFLLESVTGGERVSRYSFLGAGPREILRLYEDRLEIEREGVRSDRPGPPLEALRSELSRISAEIPGEMGAVPFTG